MKELKKSELVGLLETLDTDETNGILDNPYRVLAETDPDKMEPDYVPTPSAKKMHDSGCPFVYLRGPIGCGKSHAVVRQLLNVMVSIPPSKIDGVRYSRILCIRNTADQLKMATYKTFSEAWPDQISYDYYPSTMTAYIKFKLDDDTWVSSEVLFRAYELESSLRGLDGLEITALWCNESRSISQDIFTRAVSRIRYPGTRHIPREKMRRFVYCDSNSHPKTNWNYPYWYVLNANSPKHLVIDYPSALSPDAENLENLPPDYYEDLLTMPSNYIKAFVENEFMSAKTGLSCWPSFNHKVNVLDKPANRLFPIFLGIDNGRDAKAVLFNDLGEGRLHIVDEWGVSGRPLNESMEEMAEYFASKYPRENGWLWDNGGHDIGFAAGNQNDNTCGEDYLRIALKKYGLPQTGRATTNDPLQRVRVVDGLFAQKNHLGVPLLTVYHKCHNLITAIDEYKYKRVSSFQEGDSITYSEKPDKGDPSDWCDAVQYGVLRPKSGGHKLVRQSFLRDSSQRGDDTTPAVLTKYVPAGGKGIVC